MTIETTKIITETPASTENATTVGKETTVRLIVGRRIKRKKMNPTTYLWGPQSVDKYQNMTKTKTPKNGWETAEHHRT